MIRSKILFVGIVLFSLTYGCAAHAIAQKPIVVVIPSYNNSMWYKQNLDSVFMQRYDNYRIIYINDCSDDGMDSLLDAYVKEHNYQDKITIVYNPVRSGALYNIYHAVHQCDDHCIIVQLDGDDWLKHDMVLARINQEYQDPDVWMTYGQFEIFPLNIPGAAAQIPSTVIKEQSYRKISFCALPLRTFYAGLFKRIAKTDLLHNGIFYSAAWDLAFMFPLLEMAGDHARFIPETLYVYNGVNPISDCRLRADLQHELALNIRTLPPYAPLD